MPPHFNLRTETGPPARTLYSLLNIRKSPASRNPLTLSTALHMDTISPFSTILWFCNKNMILPDLYHDSGHYAQQQEVPFIRSLHFQLLKLDQQNQCRPISTPRAWTKAIIRSQHIQSRGLCSSGMRECVNGQTVADILKQCRCPEMSGTNYPVIQHHIAEEQKHQKQPSESQKIHKLVH